MPIAFDVFSGNTSDTLTVVPMLVRLRAMGLARIVWVADRGMSSDANMTAVRAQNLDYILGVRLRATEELRAAISADTTPYEQAAEGLMVKQVRVANKRMVVCFSPASAARDLKLRTGAIDRLDVVLKRVHGGADAAAITEHGLYRRLVSRHADGRCYPAKEKLEREAQCDGTFVLEVSNETMSAASAALAYKGLLRVEQAFRGLKHGVDVRPVYHRLDKRIRAHVTLCTLAYLLERIVEIEAKVPFEQVRKLLGRTRTAELHFDKQVAWETGKAPANAQKIPAPTRVLGPGGA